jgi:hypothetical protein
VNRQQIFDMINEERGRQDAKHGPKNMQRHPLHHKRITVTAEELGEVALTLDQIDCEPDPSIRRELLNHYISEWLQVTALGVQHLEVLLEYVKTDGIEGYITNDTKT